MQDSSNSKFSFVTLGAQEINTSLLTLLNTLKISEISSNSLRDLESMINSLIDRNNENYKLMITLYEMNKNDNKDLMNKLDMMMKENERLNFLLCKNDEEYALEIESLRNQMKINEETSEDYLAKIKILMQENDKLMSSYQNYSERDNLKKELMDNLYALQEENKNLKLKNIEMEKNLLEIYEQNLQFQNYGDIEEKNQNLTQLNANMFLELQQSKEDNKVIKSQCDELKLKITNYELQTMNNFNIIEENRKKLDQNELFSKGLIEEKLFIIQDLHQKLEGLLNKNVELNDLCNELKNDNNDYEQTIEYFRKENDLFQKTFNMQKSKIEELEKKNHLLEQERQEARKKIETLKLQTDNESKKLNEEKLLYGENLKILENNFNAKTKSNELNYMKTISDLNENLKKNKNYVVNLTRLNEELNQLNNKKKKESEELKSQLDIYISKYEYIKNNLTDFYEENDEKTDHLIEIIVENIIKTQMMQNKRVQELEERSKDKSVDQIDMLEKRTNKTLDIYSTIKSSSLINENFDNQLFTLIYYNDSLHQILESNILEIENLKRELSEQKNKVNNVSINLDRILSENSRLHNLISNNQKQNKSVIIPSSTVSQASQPSMTNKKYFNSEVKSRYIYDVDIYKKQVESYRKISENRGEEIKQLFSNIHRMRNKGY